MSGELLLIASATIIGGAVVIPSVWGFVAVVLGILVVALSVIG